LVDKIQNTEYNHPAFQPTGLSGSVELEKAFLQLLARSFETFVKKQHDYGPHNIGVGGLAGVAVRIGDKTSRLHNLLKGVRGSACGESLYDTLEDLANYALIGCLLLSNNWPESTPEDAWGALAQNIHEN
jgi:hypothetical protein